MNYIITRTSSDELKHFGIKGQKWGVRRYENEDGTLTEEGKLRYRTSDKEQRKLVKYLSGEKGGRRAFEKFEKTKQVQEAVRETMALRNKIKKDSVELDRIRYSIYDKQNSKKLEKYQEQLARKYAKEYSDGSEESVERYRNSIKYGEYNDDDLIELYFKNNPQVKKRADAVEKRLNDEWKKYEKATEEQAKIWLGNHANDIIDKKINLTAGKYMAERIQKAKPIATKVKAQSNKSNDIDDMSILEYLWANSPRFNYGSEIAENFSDTELRLMRIPDLM